LQRAGQLAEGETPWWKRTGTSVVHGYRSRVDGSVQPYAVTYPADFGKDPEKKWRVDVVLHGRDASLTEVKFIHQHSSGKPAPKDQPFVQIDIYGRGNNAYRWAGETDVLEAITDTFLRDSRTGLDSRRVVLRGFSMGGAGTWHLGLHHPDKWRVIGPGAGFSTTRGYLKSLPDPLPPHVAACLHIYDAVDYAENASMVPVVAYAGDKDPQIAAGRAVEKRLKELGIPMTFLIAPGLEHKMPPEWQERAEKEYAKYAGPGKGRPAFPKKIRFTTYTLKYPKCEWVEILALERHYQPAKVEAECGQHSTIRTTNVRAMRISFECAMFSPSGVQVDDSQFSYRAWEGFVVEKRNGNWARVEDTKEWRDRLAKRSGKVSGLTGPIDDAFTGPFLCVRGTGRPWHPAVGNYVDADLKRFAAEWDKYLRGTLPVKNDTAITEADIQDKNLILFGDPASNALIARVLDKLPLEWTAETLALSGKSYDPARHLPVLIFPNPLNPKRYVVLNSGHTFHAKDFQGTNALLYPRLGDYAVLKLPEPGAADPLAATVATAGLFDDDWRFPAK
jgi:predicted esterase